MKLYNSRTSPFGARILIAARAKGIEIEQLAPPAAGLKSPEFLAINPMGKVPVMILDDGTVLPESEVILRYLEARFPDPSLCPADAAQRARVDLIIRIMDTYVMEPVIRLFPHIAPAARVPATVDAEAERWRRGLALLAQLLLPIPAAPAGITMADCVLAPSLHLNALIAGRFGLGDLLAPHPVLADYDARIRAHPLVQPVLDDMTAAQAGR